MKKNFDNKVALKLINQYADQYKRIEEENLSLKNEIQNLSTNLKINKDIIEGFCKSNKLQEKENLFLVKLKEENSNNQLQIENFRNEITQLRSKVLYYESILNDSILAYRNSVESLENKIFILENSIIKKDNIIAIMTGKINTRSQKPNGLSSEKEIYDLKKELQKYKTKDESVNKQFNNINNTNNTNNIQFQHMALPKMGSGNFNEKFIENSELCDYLNKKIPKFEELYHSFNNLPSNLVMLLDSILDFILNKKNQILKLLDEKDLLNIKNSELNGNNIALSKCLLDFKNKFEKIKKEKLDAFNKHNSEILATNSSMVNNTCRADNKLFKKYTNSYLTKFFDSNKKDTKLEDEDGRSSNSSSSIEIKKYEENFAIAKNYLEEEQI